MFLFIQLAFTLEHPKKAYIGVEIVFTRYKRGKSRKKNGIYHQFSTKDLQRKDMIIVSEIKGFFTSSEKVVSVILNILSSSKFSDKNFGFSTACNLQFRSRVKLILLLVFLFFQLKDLWSYTSSGLYKILSYGKDMFTCCRTATSIGVGSAIQ